MNKLATTLLAAGAALAATATAQAADAKACWIYVGPIGDYGWSYQHHQGLLAVEEQFGDRVETAYLESVSEGADAERAIERFARSGCDIIFTTSFGFMDATNKIAARFPDVKFEHATGYKRESENVATYNSKFYQGRYVLGQIAASVSEAGVAGYIGSFPIPEVVRGINAFMLGAQSINPDFEVKVVWVNTWFDPGRESDAAKALVDQGVDIMVQHTDSTAPMQVAAERGIKAFGQASDMFAFGEETQLTSIVDDWASYYIERVGGARRHLGAARCLGRARRGARGHGAVLEHAVRRRRDGHRHRKAHHGGRFRAVHRPDQQAGRDRVAGRRRDRQRRRTARHELLHRRHRRPASGVIRPSIDRQRRLRAPFSLALHRSPFPGRSRSFTAPGGLSGQAGQG